MCFSRGKNAGHYFNDNLFPGFCLYVCCFVIFLLNVD